MTEIKLPLTNDQMAELERLARSRGVSVSALLQEEVEHLLRRPVRDGDNDRRRRALAVAGRFHSGRGDLAARHDDYFAGTMGE